MPVCRQRGEGDEGHHASVPSCAARRPAESTERRGPIRHDMSSRTPLSTRGQNGDGRDDSRACAQRAGRLIADRVDDDRGARRPVPDVPPAARPGTGRGRTGRRTRAHPVCRLRRAAARPAVWPGRPGPALHDDGAAELARAHRHLPVVDQHAVPQSSRSHPDQTTGQWGVYRAAGAGPATGGRRADRAPTGWPGAGFGSGELRRRVCLSAADRRDR